MSNFAVVGFTTPASTGTLDVTDPEITTPSSRIAALLFYGGTTDDATQTNGVGGLGMVACDDGATGMNRALGLLSQAGRTSPSTTLTRTHGSNTTCLLLPEAGASAASDIEAAFSSVLSTGVRLNFSKVDGGLQVPATAVLFGGMTRVWVDNASASTIGVHVDAGSGATRFRPNLVILCTFSGSFSALTANNDLNFSLGFAIDDGTPSQKCLFENWDTAVSTTDADGEVRTNRAGGELPAGRTEEVVQVTSFDSTGFNVQSNAGSPDFMFLAIQFSDARALSVAIESIAASSGVQNFTGLGRSQALVLGAVTPFTGTADTLTDAVTLSAFGAFAIAHRQGGGQARSFSMRERSDLSLVGNSTEASTRSGTDAVLSFDHLGALAIRASYVGPLPQGYALNFSTSTAGQLITLGIGYLPGIPIAPRPRRVRRVRRRLLQRLAAPLGKAPKSMVVGRFLRALTRMRHRQRIALRRPDIPLTIHYPQTPTDQGSKGRFYVPGVRRGRIVAGPGEDPDQ